MTVATEETLAPQAAGTDLSGTAPINAAAPIVATLTRVRRSVCITADLANTDYIYVSFAAVAAAAASCQLGAGDSATIEINDASKLFVNATIAGQKWRAGVL